MNTDKGVKNDAPSYEQVLIGVKLLFRETRKAIWVNKKPLGKSQKLQNLQTNRAKLVVPM